MSTYGAAHEQSWLLDLKDNVFPAVIAGLEKKGLDISIDELFSYLSLSKTSIPIVTASTGLSAEAPSYLVGNGGGGNNGGSNGSSIVNGVSKGGRSNKEPYTGPTCQYVFSKGAHKGEYCALPCAPGNPKYCKACSRKKAAGGQGSVSSSGATTSVAGGQDSSDGDTNVLDAILLDEAKGLYRETQHNLLIQQRDDSTYTLGVITDPDNIGTQLRTLNDAEKFFCSQKNIIILESAPESTSTTTTVAATTTVAKAATSTSTTSTSTSSALSDVESIIKNLQKK